MCHVVFIQRGTRRMAHVKRREFAGTEFQGILIYAEIQSGVLSEFETTDPKSFHSQFLPFEKEYSFN